MTTWMLVALLMAGAAERTEISLPVRLQVSAEGAVTAVEMPTSIRNDVAERVRAGVEAWRFEPHDAPRTVEARLLIRAEQGHGGAGTTLRLERVAFGSGGMPDRQRAPTYPAGALQHGVVAAVEVRLLVGDGGRVADAHIHRVGVGGVRMSASREDAWRRRFARSTLAAVKHWRFDPALIPAGTTVGYRVTYLKEGMRDDEWLTLAYDEPTPPPWNAETVVDLRAWHPDPRVRPLRDHVGMEF